jgi:GST-like protein
MIELYTWGTTNGRRPIIMLEEIGMPYKLIPIDIRAGANKTPEHMAISPFGKIPAMIDTDAGGKRVSMFESTAIVLYLAEKSGKLLGSNPVERADIQKWFIFGVANILPMFATMRQHKELEEVAIKLLDVQEGQLAKTEYLAGAYSIADLIQITRLEPFIDHEWMKTRPNVKRWLEKVKARPAVKKGLEMKIG